MSAPHNALGISMRYKNGWEAWKTMSVPKDFTMERLDYDRFAIYDAEGNRHSTLYERRAYLDPSFWSCLGKARGWSDKKSLSAWGGVWGGEQEYINMNFIQRQNITGTALSSISPKKKTLNHSSKTYDFIEPKQQLGGGVEKSSSLKKD